MKAARDNDVATVKKLTLAFWGPDAANQPLPIASRESLEVSPFATAAQSGHFELAKIMVYIAEAQNHSNDQTSAGNALLNIRDQCDVYSELADDDLTIATVKAVSGLVKNSVTPREMVMGAS